MERNSNAEIKRNDQFRSTALKGDLYTHKKTASNLTVFF